MCYALYLEDSTVEIVEPAEKPKWADWLGRVFCRLKGHDYVLHFETHKVTMRCTNCGHDSPGWDLKLRNPYDDNQEPQNVQRAVFEPTGIIDHQRS